MKKIFRLLSTALCVMLLITSAGYSKLNQNRRSASSDASFYIQYNKKKGLWLSVLIEVKSTRRDTRITSVSGKWGYGINNGKKKTKDFHNPVLVDRWAVNTEYKIGKKYASGTQVYGQVHASAKLVRGYIPEFSRVAIATIP